MPTERLVPGSQTTIVSGANLNGLTNNSLVAGSAFDNTPAAAGDGAGWCDVELSLDGFGGSVTANTGFNIWFLIASDGTTYEDGSSSVTPARPPDQVIPLRAVSTAQIVSKRMLLPWGKITPLIQNAGTGQTVNANNNSFLKIRPVAKTSS